MKRPWLLIAETSGARVYGLVAGLVSLSLTARMLGPEGRGVIATAYAWVTLLAAFCGLSLGQVAHHRVQGRSGDNWLPALLGTLLAGACAASLVGYAAVGAVHLVSGGTVFGEATGPVLLIALAMLPFLVWEDYGSNLLAASGRLRNGNLAQVGGRTLQVAAIALLVGVFQWGEQGAMAGMLVGQMLVALLFYSALRRAAARQALFSRTECTELMKGAVRLHLNTVGAFVLANASILILARYAPAADVGNYQLAQQMLMVLMIVPQGAALVLYSQMSKAGADGIWEWQKRLMVQVVSLMTLCAAAAWVLAGPVVHLLAGPRFEPAAEMFRMMLPTLFGLTLAQMMTCQWVGRGIFLLNTAMTTTIAAGAIVANLILIPRFGVDGAIWAGWATYACIVALGQLVFAAWCESRFRK